MGWWFEKCVAKLNHGKLWWGVVVFGQLIMVHRVMFIFRCVSSCLPMQKCGSPPNLARIAASSSSSSSQPPTSSSSLPGPPVLGYLHAWSTITNDFWCLLCNMPNRRRKHRATNTMHWIRLMDVWATISYERLRETHARELEEWVEWKQKPAMNTGWSSTFTLHDATATEEPHERGEPRVGLRHARDTTLPTVMAQTFAAGASRLSRCSGL